MMFARISGHTLFLNLVSWGGWLGFLTVLDVADLSEGLVVPEPAVELPVAGDVSKLLNYQGFEDAQWFSGWSFWSFLMMWLGYGLFYVVEVQLRGWMLHPHVSPSSAESNLNSDICCT
jgi:hypothetical protein